jgi:hypothetical protein
MNICPLIFAVRHPLPKTQATCPEQRSYTDETVNCELEYSPGHAPSSDAVAGDENTNAAAKDTITHLGEGLWMVLEFIRGRADEQISVLEFVFL